MKGTKLLISATALLAATAGTAGLLLNTKKAKRRRAVKRIGQAMYTAGTMLRALSCQMEAE